MDIKKLITRLQCKYHTRDIFEIAKAMGILIIYEELGSIWGYYTKQCRIKQIHINCNLDRHMKEYTCAHELGHAIMDPNSNTPFLRSNTFLSVNKLENRANKFAMEFLIPDEFILENWKYTIDQMACMTGYSKELIELRLK